VTPRSGRVARLHRERAGDALLFARVEGEQERPRLEVRAAYRVDEGEPGGHHPRHVDAGQQIGRDFGLFSRLVAEPAQAHLGPSHDQRREGAAGRLRHVHADGVEHAAEGLHRFVDVTAAKELLGGPTA
jgi:hypothetical protein